MGDDAVSHEGRAFGSFLLLRVSLGSIGSSGTIMNIRFMRPVCGVKAEGRRPNGHWRTVYLYIVALEIPIRGMYEAI